MSPRSSVRSRRRRTSRSSPISTQHGIPDLFIATGDDWVIDRKKYPWTIGGIPVFRVEAQIFGRYILVNMPTAKVGLLRSTDQMGDSYVEGIRQGMGADFGTYVVKQVPVSNTATNIDAEWKALRDAGATAVIVAASPTIGARAITLAHDGDWHPQLFINFAASASVLGARRPRTSRRASSPPIPMSIRPIRAGSRTARSSRFNDFVAKYPPDEQMGSIGYMLAGYVSAQAMAQVLRQCGDDLSRQNIMLQATNLQAISIPVGLIPGINFFTSRTKYLPIVEAALRAVRRPGLGAGRRRDGGVLTAP